MNYNSQELMYVVCDLGGFSPYFTHFFAIFALIVLGDFCQKRRFLMFKFILKEDFTMKKNLLALLLAVGMIFTITACGNDTGNGSANVTETTTSVTDRQGKEIQIPETVNKIISTSPSNTEILVGLGLKDKIIAADAYSADAGIDVKIATIDMQNINIEQLISLAPDVIVLNGINESGNNPYAELEKAGTSVLYLPEATSFADIKSDIKFLSDYTKTTEKGEEIISKMDKRISEIKEIGDKITDKKSVYFEISSAPYCYTTGTNTFVNEMLEIIGADNVFADQKGWMPVNEANVIEKNPDIILTNVNFEGYDYKEILARNGWNATNAVKNGSVFQVDANSTGRASQNAIDGLNAVAKAIYPDLYK
ncbi:MAG: ABC transporter substrate-binding protein [Oscillospiraceae bacterium]